MNKIKQLLHSHHKGIQHLKDLNLIQQPTAPATFNSNNYIEHNKQYNNTHQQIQSQNKIKFNIPLKNFRNNLKKIHNKITYNFQNNIQKQKQLFQNNFKHTQQQSRELNNNISQIKISSAGYGNIGSNNIIFLDNHQALIPIGPNIGIWDLKSASRKQLIQVSNDSIFIMLETSMLVIVISVSGSAHVLQKDSLKLIHTFQTAVEFPFKATVNEKYLALVSDSTENNKIQAEIYSLDKFDVPECQPYIKQFQLEEKRQFKQVFLTNTDQLIILYEKLIEQEISSLNNQSEHSIRKYYQYTFHSYNLFGEVLVNQSEIILETKIQCIQNSACYAAALTRNRLVVIIYLINLKILYNSVVQDSQLTIFNLSFIDNDSFIFSPAKNYLFKINCSSLNENSLPNHLTIHQQSNNETLQLIYIESAEISPSQKNIRLLDNYVFSSNEEGFSFFNLDNLNDQVTYKGIEMSSSCLSVNQDGSLIAIGDLTGNVLIFNQKSLINNKPIVRFNLQNGGIRSLDWNSKVNSLFIGTLDGSVFSYKIHNEDDQIQLPQLLCKQEGSITSLQFNYKIDQQTLLLTSNINGYVTLYKQNQYDTDFIEVLKYLAHAPSKSSEKFGSLNKYAEIWSTSWSSDKALTFATSSEDQQIKIFDYIQSDIKLIKILGGHSLAVTSLDWKQMNPKLGHILASCSDDLTIQIFDAQKEYVLINSFSTSFIKEWHTLTYLSLEEGGTRVAVGSQNGYLFILDLIEQQFIFAQKIHMGGIEGVIWKGDKIYTCSNDCTINVLTINEQQPTQ